MKAYKIVSADLSSVWQNGPCTQMRRNELEKQGIMLPPGPIAPLTFSVGQEIDGGPVGVFCYDALTHPMLTNGAWRLEYPDARILVLEFDETDVVEHRKSDRTGG